MIFKKLLTHHFLKVGSFLLIALYPFIIYISLQYFQVKRLSLLFLVIFLLHLFVFQKKHILNNWGKYSILLMIISIILLSHLFNHAIFLKLYPVLMSLIFFSFFTYSIFYPPSLIESIARIKHKNLPSKAISYTRNVTILWSIFLGINTLISAYTAIYSSLEIWTLYNGGIFYLFTGMLFVGEYIYRCFFLKIIKK